MFSLTHNGQKVEAFVAAARISENGRLIAIPGQWVVIKGDSVVGMSSEQFKAEFADQLTSLGQYYVDAQDQTSQPDSRSNP